jgi:lysophospholipase L1-like esterase
MDALFSSQKTNQKIPFHSKSLLRVSCLGDSITAGNFNFPHASSVWYPTHANHLLAENPKVTKTSGNNLFIPENALLQGDASLAAGKFTLVSNFANLSSGIFMNPKELLPVDERLYLLTAELDGILSPGGHFALMVYGTDSKGQIIDNSLQWAGGFDTDSHGYVKVSYVFSPSFIASLDPAVIKVGIGVMLRSNGQMSTGQVHNMQLYELAKGIAVHNQGVSYTTVAEGLKTIDKVIKWNPVICIIAYGTNDIRNGITLEEYWADLRCIVDILEENQFFPVIATLPPLGDDQVNYDKVPEWNEFITSSAHELGIGLWDRWQAFDNGDVAFIEDGRHPTKQGYLRLGEDVLRFFI